MNPATSSGRKTADSAISARPALVKTVILEGDGINACSVTLYDNASAATGNVLVKILLSAGESYTFFNGDSGVEANYGIFADVDGSGAAYIVHYAAL